MSESFDILCNW